MVSYNNPKEAISNIFNIPKNLIKKINTTGIQNDGIYTSKDRIFKVCWSKKEYLAAKRLINKSFKNVVNVYSAHECDIYFSPYFCKSYIIEEEKLYRKKKSFAFNNLDISKIPLDFDKRLPYFVSVLNGLLELASVGIVHYDIHPLNIMFDKHNNPKIIDFGISKLKKTYNVKSKSIFII